MSDSIKKIHIHTYREGVTSDKEDVMAVEDPVEIQLLHPEINNGSPKSVSITMRTPGNDAELALGFLFTEGIIKSMRQVKQSQVVGPNTVWVTLDGGMQLNLSSLERNFYTTSSCGVCGKASIDAIRTASTFDIDRTAPVLSAQDLCHLRKQLRASQSIFSETGGIHAAALFNGQLELLDVREDVGRHNALDKLIGYYFMQDDLPLASQVLLLSGRASFELLQKAGMAGIPVVAAVGAPSSLAVEVAEELGITLIGFLKPEGFNIYSHMERIAG